ncbi:hypothetical protein V7146_16165 [Gottfriedia acidiceleris]|uniref:DUF7226 domain-containing protein n=1 Tax=Gottfriedia acidiceleris TaxID=371036 RepID=UPI002FFFD45C
MDYQFSPQSNKLLKTEIINLAYETISIEEDQDIPFPQADNFNNITLLFNELKKGKLKKEEITKLLGYTTRQTDYYTNSAIYLGLVEKDYSKDGIIFCLTNKGKRISTYVPREEFLNIIKAIFEHAVFKRTFLESIENGGIVKERVLEIMIEENLKITSDSTLYRRAKTIISWIDWINSKIK